MAYFRKRYHPPGTAPGTLIEHRDIVRHLLRVSLIDFTATELEEHEDVTVADCRPYLERVSVTWIHVQGHPDRDTLQGLAELFDLHPLALEDVSNQGQRPKLESYDAQLFVTTSLPLCEGKEARMEIEQVSLFMGHGYVLSFHAGAADPFEAVRRRLRSAASRLRGRGADYLLYALVDRVIDQGFPVLERFGEQIEDVEMELLDRPDQDTLNRIHEIKRDLLLLRRMLWPQREVINLLLRDDHALVREDTKLYLRDCYDHSVQIMDLMETYRDMTASMLDVYLSSSSNRLNETMRVLTVIATVFIPLTFIVGVYGMNFENAASPWAMPELKWYYGYPLVWLVMIVIAVGMLAFFRRRRWL